VESKESNCRGEKTGLKTDGLFRSNGGTEEPFRRGGAKFLKAQGGKDSQSTAILSSTKMCGKKGPNWGLWWGEKTDESTRKLTPGAAQRRTASALQIERRSGKHSEGKKGEERQKTINRAVGVKYVFGALLNRPEAETQIHT